MTDAHPDSDTDADGPPAELEDHYFYLYETGEDEGESPLFGFWRQRRGHEECLYHRPPEMGKWISPSVAGEGYEPVPPTDALERILGHIAAFPENLPVTPTASLDPHEQFFVQLVHGTINQGHAELPPEVWSYIESARDRWCVDGESRYVCIDCDHEFVEPSIGNLDGRELCPRCSYAVFEKL